MTRRGTDIDQQTDDTVEVASSGAEDSGPSSSSVAAGSGSSSSVHQEFNLLVDEFAERCRNGEAPSVDAYAEAHPELAELIRKFLPTIALMEGIKRRERGEAAAGLLPSQPQRLGEFRVVREIGHGGMGVVYEAVQESLGRSVALKLIPKVHLNPQRLQRFRREAEAVARLHHTNIVPIFGVGEQDGIPFYVMQLIRGTALDELIARWHEEGPPPPHERWRFIARFGVQAASALHYAHEQGVLHRDVKPANFLIDEQEAVWITDFGLAKLVGHNDLTGPGDIVGTLRYLAPEGLRGVADDRSDQYGLGMTLYELLTLRLPFGDLSPSELVKHVREDQPVRPRKLDPTIPRDLETIVLKATAKEPRHRYESAASLGEDLARFLDDRPIRARPISSVERAWRWARRNPLIAGLCCLTVALLVLAASLGWAGYASTTRALKLAQDNETLSLGIFDRLFDRLGVQDNFLPPPPGRSARRRLPMPGWRPDGGAGGGRGQPPAPHPERLERTAAERRGEPPPGAFGGPPPAVLRPLDEQALLADILSFYEKFANQNSSNTRLQHEAASAYRRVGAILDNLGRTREARVAFARATNMLERLVADHPEVPGYRIGLIETDIMANPWTADESELEDMENRLRRAETHIRLLESQGSAEAQARVFMVHDQAKLGSVLKRRGRRDGARACYERALAVCDQVLSSDPDALRIRVDRSDVRELLATLEIEDARKDSARALLRDALSDLEIAARERIGDAIADRADDLAEDYLRLGDEDQAAKMDVWAGHLRRGRPPTPIDPRAQD